VWKAYMPGIEGVLRYCIVYGRYRKKAVPSVPTFLVSNKTKWHIDSRFKQLRDENKWCVFYFVCVIDFTRVVSLFGCIGVCV